MCVVYEWRDWALWNKTGQHLWWKGVCTIYIFIISCYSSEKAFNDQLIDKYKIKTIKINTNIHNWFFDANKSNKNKINSIKININNRILLKNNETLLISVTYTEYYTS